MKTNSVSLVFLLTSALVPSIIFAGGAATAAANHANSTIAIHQRAKEREKREANGRVNSQPSNYSRWYKMSPEAEIKWQAYKKEVDDQWEALQERKKLLKMHPSQDDF